MKLYLVQHGAAIAKDEDPRRPLSEQGRADVEALAGFLKSAGVRVERVWHSSKLRAEQTAQTLAKAVMPSGRIEVVSGINPKDPVNDFVADADVWQQDTLIVGHLPFMSRLVSLLIADNPEQAIVSYSPGSVACLQRVDAHEWSLLWMLRPDLMAED